MNMNNFSKFLTSCITDISRPMTRNGYFDFNRLKDAEHVHVRSQHYFI